METKKRSQEEINQEYRSVMVQFGDREYKIKALKQTLEVIEKESAMLFIKLNQITQEVLRDYPELVQELPQKPAESPPQPPTSPNPEEPLPPVA